MVVFRPATVPRWVLFSLSPATLKIRQQPARPPHLSHAQWTQLASMRKSSRLYPRYYCLVEVLNFYFYFVSIYRAGLELIQTARPTWRDV